MSAGRALHARRSRSSASTIPASTSWPRRSPSASYALADVAADIAGYATALDADPARLAFVQERRAVLGALTRKYGDTVDEVLAWSETAAERLLELEDDDSRLEALRAGRRPWPTSSPTSAAALDRASAHGAGRRPRPARDDRARRAGDAARACSSSAVDAARRAAARRSRRGRRSCSAPTTAATRGRCSVGASGGELSRVMLALEVCLVGTQPVPTMVFDEVDAGVGGKAAVEIGRRLARLARAAQVIVVTHLPQVAAFADQHYVVVKSDDGSVTTSGVTALDDAGTAQRALAHAGRARGLRDRAGPRRRAGRAGRRAERR